MAMGDKGATLDGLKASHDNLDGKITDLKSDLNNIVDKHICVNLFNGNDPDILINSYLDPNGSFKTYNGRGVTGFMPVTSGKKVVCSSISHGKRELTNMSSTCFYRSDKSTVVSGGAYNTKGVTVPNDAKYVRVTVGTNLFDNELQIELSDTVEFSPYEEYYESYVSLNEDVSVPELDDVKSEVNELKNELKSEMNGLKVTVSDTVLMVSGCFTSTTLDYWRQTAQRIGYFKCKPNTVYTISKSIATPDYKICYIKEEPRTGGVVPVFNYVVPASGESVTYTTGDDALYLLILFGVYTGGISNLQNALSITSDQIVIEDGEARSIITYDEAYLPSNLYMIANKDYEIYHNQICPKGDNYTFKWNSGVNYGNRVRVNYDSTGDKTLTCSIYNADGTLAKQLTSTVHVVNLTAQNIYLLPFGDSLTNHCVWESELMNIAENITCVGSRSRQVKDSDGETRTVYDEGRAGFTSFNYTSGTSYSGGMSDSGGDESPHNKWYDPSASKFSAQYYFANHFPSNQTAPNVLTFFLGMNDLLGTNTVDAIVANIKGMIDDIISYNSAIKIILISPQLRYLPSLNGHEHLLFLDFAEKMEQMASDYSNIVFLPLPIGMDSVNNYNMQTVTINTRNPETEETAPDITHPASYGYWQIADYVIGAISYIMP